MFRLRSLRKPLAVLLSSVVYFVACSHPRAQGQSVCLVSDPEMLLTIENRIYNGLISHVLNGFGSDYTKFQDTGWAMAPVSLSHDRVDTVYVRGTMCVGTDQVVEINSWELCRSRKSGTRVFFPKSWNDTNTFSMSSSLCLTQITTRTDTSWALSVIGRYGDTQPLAMYSLEQESLQCFAEPPSPAQVDEFIKSQRAVESILIEEGLLHIPDWVSIDLLEVEVCEKDLVRLIGGIPESLAE